MSMCYFDNNTKYHYTTNCNYTLNYDYTLVNCTTNVRIDGDGRLVVSDLGDMLKNEKEQPDMNKETLIKKIGDFLYKNGVGGYYVIQDAPQKIIEILKATGCINVDMTLHSADFVVRDADSHKIDPDKIAEWDLQSALHDTINYCVYNFIGDNTDIDRLAAILFGRIKNMYDGEDVKTILLIEEGDKRDELTALVNRTGLLDDEKTHFEVKLFTEKDSEYAITIACLYLRYDVANIKELVHRLYE